MRDIYEIRIHGRAGQGAKSAAHFLAAAAFAEGKYVQAFPSYGPERMGAPMNAFVRISEQPIRVHSDIYEADAVLVIDSTLLDQSGVTSGVKSGGIIVVNSTIPAARIKEHYNLNYRVVSVDASGIAREIFGKNLPNTGMIAAAAKAAGFVSDQSLVAEVKDFFTKKYNAKVGEQNIRVMELAADKLNNNG